MIYKNLKELEGRVLALEDNIVFKVGQVELIYTVQPQHCRCIYPEEFLCENGKVFELLSLTEEQTRNLARRDYGYDPFRGSWPEYSTFDLKAATRFVNGIYQIIEDMENKIGVGMPSPKYEVGDMVILRKRYHPGRSSCDYPYGFPEQMLYEAKSIRRAKIVEVCMDDSKEFFPMYEEPYKYQIKGSGYIWTSAMFEGKVEESLGASPEAIKEYTIEYFIPRKVWVKNHFANTDAKSKQVITLSVK